MTMLLNAANKVYDLFGILPQYSWHRTLGIIFISSTFIYITVGWHILHIIIKHGIDINYLLLDFMTMVWLFCFQMGLIVAKRQEERKHKLLAAIANSGTFGSPETLLAADKTINLFVHVINFWVLPFFLVVIPILVCFMPCEEHVESTCGFIVDVYLGFNIYYTPVRQIIMLMQSLFIAISSYFLMNGLAYLFSIPCFINCRIYDLESRLKKLKRCPTMENVKFCVQYYLYVCRLWNDYLIRLQDVYLLFSLASAEILTLTIYKIYINPDFQSIIVCIGSQVFIHLIATISEHINEQIPKLRMGIFEAVPWDGNVKLQRSMLLFMMCTNRQMYIKTGLFGVYNRQRVLAIYKTLHMVLIMLHRRL